MNRCEAYLKALPGNASLIHRPENIRWLTGYTGEGCAFIANAAQVIITDFRYVEQAGRQAPECACERTGNGVTEAAGVRATSAAASSRVSLCSLMVGDLPSIVR